MTPSNCETCGHEADIHIAGKGDCLEYVLLKGKRDLCPCPLFVEPRRDSSGPTGEETK